jgi:methyl-accepting chemotaxis protein
MWTFGRKIAMGFVVAFLLPLAIACVAYRNINVLASTSLKVARAHDILYAIDQLMSEMKDAETGQRGYIITGEDEYLEPYNNATTTIPNTISELRQLTAGSPEQQKRVDALEPVITAKLVELKLVIDLREKSTVDAAVKEVRTGRGRKFMDQVRGIIGEMDRGEREVLRLRAIDVETASGNAKSTIVVGTIVSMLFLLTTAIVIIRSFNNQIGSAVRHMQSSSTELQSAANEQASGARESATAMTEITTTIGELLATSRQIAESAQRVAHITEQTAGAARSGDNTALKTQDSVSSIKRQVDLIVSYMLELGKKSQQIGGILEIINELSEQTNILAINATIEASGAGDSGKRFAVIADEIRKLADRVGGSTKEIRALIEEIRSSVNTTVMATEGGSKAVDLGARQFVEVTTALRQITDLLSTTAQASKEIELSTKQQSTAVEQVNIAISNVARAAKETEVSSNQTLQTAGRLANLSRDLTRMIQSTASA